MMDVAVYVVVYNAEGCELSRQLVVNKQQLKDYIGSFIDMVEPGDYIKFEPYEGEE